MMNSNEIQQKLFSHWKDLFAGKTDKNEFSNMGFQIAKFKIYAGIKDSHPCVILASSFEGPRVSKSIGRISISDIIIPNLEMGTHYQISCKFNAQDDENILYFFALMISTFRDQCSISMDSSEVVKTFEVYCEMWKKIFRPDANPEITGILGELYFLRTSMLTGIPVEWNYPCFSYKDFLWPSKDQEIEVKTTLAHNGYSVQIHGLEQLESHPGKKLGLVFLRFEKVSQGAYSISRLRKEIGLNGFTQDQIKALDKIPLLKQNDFYNLTEALYFPVDQEFPRITNSIVQDIPRSMQISNVTYQIDLSGMKSVTLSDFMNSSRIK